MKKLLGTILMCCLTIHMIGCTSTKEANNNNNIMLTNPVVETEASTEHKSLYPYEKIEHGYYVYELNNNRYAAPYDINNNMDTYDLSDWIHFGTKIGLDRQKQYSIIKRPDGTITDKSGSKINLFWGRVACPDFLWDDYESNEQQDLQQMPTQHIQAVAAYVNTKESSDADYQYVGEIWDIECISCALYEDFYEDVSPLNISIYGMDEQVFNNYIEYRQSESGEKTYWVDYQNVFSQYQQGKCELDIVLNKDITESGNYYIDYKEFQKEKTYKQMFYVVSFSEEWKNDYGFVVIGFQYKIDHEQQYEQWKQKNEIYFLK